MTRIANIDIEPAIIVDISHYGPCAPHAILPHTTGIGNVFKLPVAFVQEKFVLAHVACQEHITQSIIIDIPDRYSTSIVKVPELKTIIRIIVHYRILKIYTGILL